MFFFFLVSATPPASQLYSVYGQSTSSSQGSGLSKYAQLLAVIEEMGRDIRPTYAMGRGDRLKRLIIQAKVSFKWLLIVHIYPLKNYHLICSFSKLCSFLDVGA